MSLRCVSFVLLFGSLLPAQARGREMAASQALIEADGRAFAVSKCSGGEVVAEVVVMPIGPDRIAHKAAGNVHCEPIRIEADPLQVLPWIRDLLAGNQKALNFAIVRAGFDMKAMRRTQVLNAVLTQVEFAPFDAADAKRSLGVTLLLQPERTEEGKTGDIVKVDGAKEKRAVAGNFRVTIPGVDCSTVVSVGPIAVTVSVQKQGIGDAKMRAKSAAAGSVEHGNLVLRVVEPGIAGFLGWHRSFVVDGKNSSADLKSVTIELLAPDMKTPLLRLEGKGVGILAARATYGDSRAELAVEAFVEQWAVVN